MNHTLRNDALTQATGCVPQSILKSACPDWFSLPASEPGEKIIFILDARGRLRFFSHPESLSCMGLDLVDQPICTLVPDLPLRDETPGYNIAFAAFSFAEGSWRTYQVLRSDGSRQTAEVRLVPLALEHDHFLVGVMRLKPRAASLGWTEVPCRPSANCARISDGLEAQMDRRTLMPIVSAV